MTLATVDDRSTFRDCLKKLQWCIVLGGTVEKKELVRPSLTTVI